MSSIHNSANEAWSGSPLLLLSAPPEDAQFYGRWLLKAAEVNKYLLLYMRGNPDFRNKFLAQLDLWLANPSYAALTLQSRLVCGDGQLDLLAECPELIPGFCALAALHFFTLHHDDAEMAVPQEILETDVVRVFSKLALIDEVQWRTPDKALAQLMAA